MTYGEFITSNEAGDEKIYFFVIQSLISDMYERYNVQSENSSIEISKGKIAGE